MKRIKIAQLGTGHDHAGECFTSLRKNSDIFEVVGYAVCEDDEPIYELQKHVYEGVPRMSPEELLNIPGLEAVTVETHEHQLSKYSLLAAEKGLHIHMDKPGGEDGAEFEKLIKTVSEKKLAFHTGYMYRYNPEVQRLFEVIKSGELGEIYSVEAHMNCDHNLEKRNWLGDFKGGMMFFLGCHLIDLIFRIQGTPEEIIPLNTSGGTNTVGANDIGFAVFKYKNGVSYAKTAALEPGGYLRRQLVVCGTKGTFEIRPLEGYTGSPSSLYTKTREVYGVGRGWDNDAEFVTSEPFHRYDNMMRSFAQIVRGEKENPYSYEYELQLHKIVLAACGY